MSRAELVNPNNITEHFKWLRGVNAYPFIWISENIYDIEVALQAAYQDQNKRGLKKRNDLVKAANASLNLRTHHGTVYIVYQVVHDPEVFILMVDRTNDKIKAIMLEATLHRAE